MIGTTSLRQDHFPQPAEKEWSTRLYSEESITKITASPSSSFVSIGRDNNDNNNNNDEFNEENDFEYLDLNDIPKEVEKQLEEEDTKVTTTSSTFKTVTTAAVSAASVVAATALTIKYGNTISRAIRAGVTGAHEHFKKQNPASLQTYHPFEYVVPFFSAAVNASVLDVVNQVQGHQDDRDIEEILNAVEDHINKAQLAARELRGGWSEDQIVIAQTWLDEGRKRYKDFVTKHSKGLPMIAPATIIAGVSASTTTPALTTTTTTTKPTETKKETETEKESVTPVAPPLSSTPRVTVGEMMEATRKARELRNPSKEQLAQEDGLEDLINALEGLLTVPYLLPTITEETVRMNILKDPALGCHKFIENVSSRALMIVSNFSKPAKDRNKKLAVAASGPGTGKSVTIAQGIGWTQIPMTTLVGSTFAGEIPVGKTPFEVFAEAVRNAVCGFRVKGERVPCGFIYGDDFDRAWNRNGLFSLSTACRQRFFSFCKEVADPSITTIFKSDPHLFSYHLAKNRYFPFNWSHIHFGISCNTMPPEFLPGTADPAMIDRLGNLGADYANAADRLNIIALEHRLPAMLKKIREWYSVKMDHKEAENQINRINLETARFALASIVQADVDIVCDTFDGRLGIRGLCNVLDMYQQVVLGRLPIDRSPVDPELFAFRDWDLKMAIKLTDAYSKPPDTDMANVESSAEIAQKVSVQRTLIRSFPTQVQSQITAILDKIVPSITPFLKQQFLDQARMYTSLWSHRVELPDQIEAGRRLDRALGYFKTSSSNKLSGEIDRFPPIFTVFESIYWRLMGLRSGEAVENSLVHVRFTDPSASTPTIFNALSEVFGNLPVRTVSSEIGPLFEGLDEYTIQSGDPILSEIERAINRTNSYSVYIPSAEGEVYRLQIRKYDLSETSCVYYYQIDGKIWVIKRDLLPAVIKEFGTKNVCKISDEDKFDVIYLDQIPGTIKIKTKPRLKILDRFFDKTQLAELSTLESFVLFYVTPSILEQIQKWSTATTTNASHSNDDSSSFVRFQNYLNLCLNSESWLLENARTIDPRGITVFLIDCVSDSITSKSSIPWLIGLPPIQGRERRARATVSAAISKLNRDQERRLAILSKQSRKNETDLDMKPIVLNQEQNAVLDALMQWDMNAAVNTRDQGFQLSPVPLDNSITDFLNHVRNCTNSFGLVAPFPSINSFERVWTEKYEPEKLRVEKELEQRRLEAEAIAAAELKKQEELAIIQQAELQALAQVTYSKTKRDIYKKDWENRQLDDHNTNTSVIMSM